MWLLNKNCKINQLLNRPSTDHFFCPNNDIMWAVIELSPSVSHEPVLSDFRCNVFFQCLYMFIQGGVFFLFCECSERLQCLDYKVVILQISVLVVLLAPEISGCKCCSCGSGAGTSRPLSTLDSIHTDNYTNVNI